jgi:hypothetical protein
MEYLDFELEISPGRGREYPVAVVRSPAGEARGTMHFPYDELMLQNRLKDLQIALLRSGGPLRKVLSREEQAVQDFGRDLFDAIFSGEIRSRYDVSLQEAKRQGKGLRLKLRIQPPELAALPWEFLYDPRPAEYLCLSRHTPIVRYLELPQPIQPLTVTPPLRILGMVASPRDLKALDVTREKQRVEEALKDLQAKGMVDLTWLKGQTWNNLQQALRKGPWHVFHFIGHGGFDPNKDEGLIALANEQGHSHYFYATELARLLANQPSLRLVLLNSCEGARGSQRDIFSSTAAILVRRGIPAVLAMQYEITDRAAIEFARAFYGALADGLPVDAAVADARVAVSLGMTNTVEWGTPVLYMRSPDGVLFQVQEAASRREKVRKRLPRTEEQARQESKPQLEDQAASGERSQNIWWSITNLPFVEQLKVPGTGEKVKSKSILKRGKEYIVIARGIYSYSELVDATVISDAKDALLINEAKLEPIASSPNKHEYAFLITGTEEQASFQVSKTAEKESCVFTIITAFLYFMLCFPLFFIPLVALAFPQKQISIQSLAETLGYLACLVVSIVAFSGAVVWGYKKRFGLIKGGILVEIREGHV